LENPRFLFLEGWGVPPPRPLAPLWRLLAHPLMTSAPATGTNSTAASSVCGDGGEFPPIGGGPFPITLLLLVRRRVRWCRWRGASLLLTQPVLLVVLFQALPPPEPLRLCARRPLLLSPLRGATGRPGPRCWRVRPRGVHSHHLRARIIKTNTNTTQEPKEEEEAHSLAGRRGASQTTRGRHHRAAPT
jgi:hypothetical protein